MNKCINEWKESFKLEQGEFLKEMPFVLITRKNIKKKKEQNYCQGHSSQHKINIKCTKLTQRKTRFHIRFYTHTYSETK